MNFLKRTVTAVVFASIMLFCILKGAPWFVGLFAVCTILTTIEYTGLANKFKQSDASRLWATVAAVTFYSTIVGLSVMNGSAVLFLPFIFTLIVIMIRELYFQKPSPINDWVHTLFPVFYIALPYALTSLLAFDVQGPGTGYNPAIPLTLFIFLWCNDVGAYCVGCTLGKHKLSERISPKKTWEGSIGGAAFTMLAAFLLHTFMPWMYSFMPAWVWIGMALVVVVFGTWGDLIESLMKREMGIKDSGKILPGHGGMLDRFDSALLAIPATVVYFSLIGLYF